jgi:23S rRNA (cytidine1920-2'-O)/16S rRNA (cytidine1409-2'-O)-methyltransferase
MEARYVSRGGHKLAGALDALGIQVAGLRALDAGAATGGFTDCLLQRGVASVVAVDVAYGSLAWSLRTDPRVTVLERTNARELSASSVEPVDLVVADLSFISLATVADALLSVLNGQGMLLVMVKPQFEAPRADVPRGGVVSDPAVWIAAMHRVADAYRARGCVLAGAVASTLTGPKGNREFFLHMLRHGTDRGDDVIERAAREAP